MSQITQLNSEDIRRILGVVEGEDTGRHVVYFAGIHGNEPAGIWALKRVLETIRTQNIPVQGKLWAMEGNLPALKEKKRFLDKDLNRIWFTDTDEHAQNGVVESQQRREIEGEIERIVDEATDEVVFFDLHTTSAQSVPFMSISDTLRNRKIIEDIPVPLVLGLEEQMEGTLFNYFSEVGISMILFEAGQHDASASVDSHESFIWLTLVKLGFVRTADFPDIHIHYELLAKAGIFLRKIFQLQYKHLVKSNELFEMLPGFVNFQKVKKRSLLARENGEEIRALRGGRVFMPLYQPQGAEGFFIIDEVNRFWLKVSEWARKRQFDRVLSIAPGIKRYGKGSYILHRYVAKFTVVPIFHLLGYRVVIRHDDKFIVKRRPYDWERPPIEEVQRLLKELLN